MSLTLFRRHAASCPHRAKGRDYLKCSCPIWADGYRDGRREFRKSLKTRDMARARNKAAMLDSPDNRLYKSVEEAVEAFLKHCSSNGVGEASLRKYGASMTHLKAFCEKNSLSSIDKITVHTLDDFRAYRTISPTTARAELRLLRTFFTYCFERRWSESNPAKSIKLPKKKIESEIEPYTPAQVESVFQACDRIGHVAYERKRAKALMYIGRFTALRIGDAIMFHKDRISHDGQRWRIFLRTTKNGKYIHVPIPEEMKLVLDDVPPPQGAKEGSRYYFWNEVNSKRTMCGIAQRVARSVFKKSGVPKAKYHRFRHTLATELLGEGATFEEVADVLGNTVPIVIEHYAKWSSKRQERIDTLMERVHSSMSYNQSKLVLVKRTGTS